MSEKAGNPPPSDTERRHTDRKLAHAVENRIVERIWREVGLPEYFLGNGGTNQKLYQFVQRLTDLSTAPAETVPDIKPIVEALVTSLELFQKAKASAAADHWDGVDEVAQGLFDEAASLGDAALDAYRKSKGDADA